MQRGGFLEVIENRFAQKTRNLCCLDATLRDSSSNCL